MEEGAARVNSPPSLLPGAAPPAAGGPGGVSARQPSRPADESEETILQLSPSPKGAPLVPDNEMTEDCDGDENLTEEVMIARAFEMSMRSEPESESEEEN